MVYLDLTVGITNKILPKGSRGFETLRDVYECVCMCVGKGVISPQPKKKKFISTKIVLKENVNQYLNKYIKYR